MRADAVQKQVTWKVKKEIISNEVAMIREQPPATPINAMHFKARGRKGDRLLTITRYPEKTEKREKRVTIHIPIGGDVKIVYRLI